jgi:RHS repeat-associated protein
MRAILPGNVGSYSYAGMGYANPHAVTSVGATTYSYDNNGNVTAIGSLDYTWDWRNRLASAERSGGFTSYGYDHSGQRVFQATGSATTSYPNRYFNVASSSLTATTTKHIFSTDGTLLAVVENTPEESESMGFAGNSLQLPDASESSARAEESPRSILPLLEGKTPKERALIKAAKIATIGPVARTKRGNYDIEIVAMNTFEGGVEVFARAWKNGKQIGFGKDGSVDIERFQIQVSAGGKNGQLTSLVVPDPNGPIEVEEDVFDPKTLTTSGTEIVRYREDPLENLLIALEHTISVIAKYGSARIVKGKIGNTTTVFTPDIGNPGTTSVDGNIRNDPGTATYAAANSASSGTSLDPNGTGVYFLTNYKQGTNDYLIDRIVTTFDTTSLGFATVDSATLSLYDSNTLDDSNTNATSIVGYTGSDASYSTTHFGNFGTTKYAADLAWAAHTHNAYNDFELNGTGVANIASHGVTTIGVRADKDVSATEPTTSNYLRYNAADHADSNTHPKLIIEHSEAPITPNMKYIHPDHLGGTNVVTDENGEMVQTLDYYPYGAQRITAGSYSEQRRFIGEEYDGDTEFSYLNARYYQGSRGQFMSIDPVFLRVGDPAGIKQMTQREMMEMLADPQVLNAYGYARGNPIILVDRQGNIAVIPALIIGGGVASVAVQAGFDLYYGQFSGWAAYTGSFVGGATYALTFLTTGSGVVAGGAGGAVQELVSQSYEKNFGDRKKHDLSIIGRRGLEGGALGALKLPRISGFTAGPGSYQQVYSLVYTKTYQGQIGQIAKETFAKTIAIHAAGETQDQLLLNSLSALKAFFDKMQRAEAQGKTFDPYAPE